MLTKKQHELLLFIDQRLAETNVSPSFEEMKVALDLKSKSGIHRLISALEERGFIRRLPHRARALEILRRPTDGADDAQAPAQNENRTNVVSGAFADAHRDDAEHGVDVPLIGKIAAGHPSDVFVDPDQTFQVPGGLIGAGQHFALEVDGESMVEAGIHDGDIAIIKHQQTAENGKIIAAIVHGERTTLKRLRRKDRSIALEPANPAFETRIFGPEQVEIQGQLVALFRKY